MYLIWLLVVYQLVNLVYSQCTIRKTINNLLIKEPFDNDITCTQPVRSITLSAALPQGIVFESQSLKFSGSASTYVFNTTYEVEFRFENQKNQFVRFYIAVFDLITKCTYGHGGIFVLNVGQPADIYGPRCNTPVYKYGIAPKLPVGLEFHNSTGRITGAARSIQNEQTYIITPYTYNESEISITISIKLRIEDLRQLPTGLYARYTPQGYCVNLTKYEMYKQFDEGSVTVDDEAVIPFPYGECSDANCDWDQNINRRHRLYFCMKVHGYLNIITPGEYHFNVRADESAFLFINNEEIPLITSINRTEIPEAKIELQPGLVVFGVLYHQSAGPYHLEVNWKTPTQSTFARIGETYFRYNQVPLQNLHYISNYLLFLNGVPRFFTPYFQGTATGFQLYSGTLPKGINFDTNNGIISGTPTEVTEDYVTVVIVASSTTGNSTVTVHIKVLPLATSSLKNGVRLSFYRPSREVSCTIVSDVNDGYHSLVEVEYEAELSRYSGAPFPSIIRESTQYIVKFVTLINIPATRQYTFSLYSTAGSYMVLDTIKLDNWGCDYGHTKSTTAELTQGLHYLEITYYINPMHWSTFGINLNWDYPDGTMDVIPPLYFRYLPEGSMQYTERAGKHFRGSDYPANRLVYHSLPTGQVLTRFRVYPNLPAGLVFNTSDGTIYGKLIGTNIRQTHFLITGETYDTSVTMATVLTIELDTNLGLYELFYHTGDLVNVTTLEGEISKPISTLYPTISGYPVSYEIADGSLPIGLHLDRESGVISGTPAQEFDSYVVIAAANALEHTSTLLTIKIKGCADITKQYFLFYMVNFDADITIDIKQGANPLFNKPITSRFTETSYSQCLDNSTDVTLSIISKAYRPPFIEIKKSGDTTMFLGLIDPYKGKVDVQFNQQVSLKDAAPKITFSNNLTAYTHVDVAFYSKIEGGITEIISVTPNLPSGLILILPGVIFGKSNTLSSMKQYTVKYRNKQSQGESIFFLQVVNCVADNDGQELVGFKLVIKAEEDGPTMSVLLASVDMPNEYYYNYISFMPYAVSEYGYCADPGEFELTLGSTDGKAWQLYSYAEIVLDNGLVLFHKTFNGKDKQFFVDLLHIINQNLPVHYLYSVSPPADYCTGDYQHWEQGITGSLKPRNTTTQYYRYTVRLIEMHQNSVIMGVQYDAGIIIRFEGKEIFRNHLPENVGPNTLATAIYDSLFYTRLSFSPQLFRGSEICIELHNHADSASYNPFGFFLDVGTGDISSIHLNQYIYGDVKTQHDDRPGYPISYLFDDNPNTQWETRSGGLSGTQMTYRFLHRGVEIVNCYAVVTGDTPRKDPITWKLYGVSGNIKVELDSQVNQTYNERQSKHIYYFYNNVSYHTYLWDITKHGDSTGFDPSTSVADFLLYSCYFQSICPTDGHWKSASFGEVVVRPCSSGYSGTITRSCDTPPNWGEIKDDCKLNAPLNMRVNNNVDTKITAFRRISFSAYIQADGAEITYSVTPDLPNGLHLDTKTGRISGVPTELINEKQFVAKASNIAGELSTNFYLTFNSNYCNDNEYCTKVEQGDYCDQPCPEGYTGGGYMRAPCIPNYAPYYGDPENHCYDDDGKSSSKGIGAGGIIGIIFGILAVAVIAFVGYRFYLYKQGKPSGPSGSRSTSGNKPAPPRNKNTDPFKKLNDI